MTTEFWWFLTACELVHMTSSSYFPESVGYVQCAVLTAKMMLTEGLGIHDMVLASLHTRRHWVRSGTSPTVADRKAAAVSCSNEPHSLGLFVATTAPVPIAILQTANTARAMTYDSQHYVIRWTELQSGMAVRIWASAATYGAILHQADSPRSYLTATDSGVCKGWSQFKQWQPEGCSVSFSFLI